MKPEHVAYSMPAIVGVLVIAAFLLDVGFPMALAMALFAVAVLSLLYYMTKSRSAEFDNRSMKGGES